MQVKDQIRKDGETLANRLADRIHRDVVDADLMEGDFFMTVDQVVGHYGVSRPIAREAISQLRALGVLKSRQRVGLLVDRPNLVTMMNRWLPVFVQSENKKDLMTLVQLRYVLELGALDFSVAHATDEQVRRLKQLAGEFQEMADLKGQGEETSQIELDYHCLILDMTHNPLIAGMHRVIADYFHAAPVQNPQWNEISPDTVWEHRAIADAIEKKDAELARILLRKHLETSLREIHSGLS